MSPIWVAKLPSIRRWQTPIDFGHHFRGKRIFGDHKTIRGLVAGTLMGALIGWLYILIGGSSDWFMQEVNLIQDINLIFFGAATGFSALAGDAIASFFKRQVKIAPGRPWVPFDQIDYILGAYLFIGFNLDLDWQVYLIGLLMYTLLHPCFSYLGYLLRLKQDPF